MTRPTIAERARSKAWLARRDGVSGDEARALIAAQLARDGTSQRIAEQHARRAVVSVYTDHKFDNRGVGAKERRLTATQGEKP